MPASEKDTSPIKIGAIVLAVALAAWGLLWLTMRPDEPSGRRAEQGPAFALTDAEAVARFEELESMLIRLYRDRDVTVIDQLFAPSSPLRPLAQKEVDQLIEDQVSFRGDFVTRDLVVIKNDGKAIVLRQVVEEYPRLVSDSGKEVTAASTKPMLRTIEWTLRLDSSRWKLFDSDTTSTQPLRQKSG